jgi:replicative DNA helicase
MSEERSPLRAVDKRDGIQDVDTECAVLGCLLGAASESEVAMSLTPAAFTGLRRHVWAAMLALHADRIQADHLTLSEMLKKQGRLVECGGPAALMELEQGVPLTHALPNYVNILLDRLERRAIIAAADMARAHAENLAHVPRKVAMTAAQALSIIGGQDTEEAPDVDIAELAVQWAEYVDRLERGTPNGLDDGVLLRTGIEQLDANGEGMPSNLCVLLGLASMGKTALAAEIIWNWLKAGVPGGIIGLEDGTKWLTRRHLARYLGIPLLKVGRTLLHDHQQARLAQWMGETSTMYRQHLRIHRAGGLHASGLLAIVTRWINAGARWIWIDHGLRVDYGMPDQRRYDLAIGKALEALATLGERHGVVIAVNWHLNRTSEQNVKPTISMAKESGYLEAAARWMLAVWEQPHRVGQVLATALKVTEGPRDWTVALERDPECALVKSKGGQLVDFAAEAEESRRLAEEARNAAKAGRPPRRSFVPGQDDT